MIKHIPADPIFCRLCSDLTLTREVEARIHAGLVDKEKMGLVRDLEIRAWEHLVAYVNALAFVDSVDEDTEDEDAE